MATEAEAVIAEIIAAEINTARAEIERLFDRRMAEFERFVERRMAEIKERHGEPPPMPAFVFRLDDDGTFFHDEASIGSLKPLIVDLLRAHKVIPEPADG